MTCSLLASPLLASLDDGFSESRSFVYRNGTNISVRISENGYIQRTLSKLGSRTLQSTIQRCIHASQFCQDHSQDLMDRRTIATLLQECVVLPEGQEVHASAIRSGLEKDTFLATLLVSMYGNCGAVEKAQLVFHKMSDRNVVSWTAMIAAYVKAKNGEDALLVFFQMQREGIKPNRVTFVSVLSACAVRSTPWEREKIHACIVESGLEADVMVGTALVNMYCKCENLEDARAIFDRMHERNVVSWTAMIAGYAKRGLCQESLQLYRQMQKEGVQANEVTFVNILIACAILVVLAEGKIVHGCIINCGFESNDGVGTALVNMYGKCGALEDAQRVFDKAHNRDTNYWSTMLSAYAQHGYAGEALKLFQAMQGEEVQPNEAIFISTLIACASLQALEEGRVMHACIVVCGFESYLNLGTALINMYSKCRTVGDARSVFDNIHQHDTVSWSAMIAAYTRQGHGEEAIHLFQEMQKKRVKQDEVTLLSMLSACASLPALAEGRVLHECIVIAGFESRLALGNALIHLYGKSGVLTDARSVLDQMEKCSVFSYTAMISAYAQRGHGKEALLLFQHMQQEGVKPDAVTFVSLLSACSHAGLVDEGLCCFSMMREIYDVQPMVEHYACIIDLFGRAGLLDEAEDIIDSGPIQHAACLWVALLASCRVHGDTKRGCRAAWQISNLDPQRAAPYVLLSNTFAADGRCSG